MKILISCTIIFSLLFAIQPQAWAKIVDSTEKSAAGGKLKISDKKQGKRLLKIISKWGKPVARWNLSSSDGNQCQAFLFCHDKEDKKAIFTACEGTVSKHHKLYKKQSCKNLKAIIAQSQKPELIEYFSRLSFEQQLRVLRRDIRVGDYYKDSLIAFPDILDMEEGNDYIRLISTDGKTQLYQFEIKGEGQKIARIEHEKNKKAVKRQKELAKRRKMEARLAQRRKKGRGFLSFLGKVVKGAARVAEDSVWAAARGDSPYAGEARASAKVTHKVEDQGDGWVKEETVIDYRGSYE